MNVCIIPARGGSKRIPQKNIRPFCGKPIIQYSIDVALTAGVFDRVIVSTDCDRIAEIARGAGAEVPFRRALSLADDKSGIEKVIPDAIRAIEAGLPSVKFACCLLATAPFLSANDLRVGLDLMKARALDFVFSATEYAFPVFRGFRRLENDGLRMLYPEHYHTRSQDLPVVWHDAGQFYWGSRNAWLKELHMFGERSGIVPIPRIRTIDIDTPEDWEFAEALQRVGEIRNVDAGL